MAPFAYFVTLATSLLLFCKVNSQGLAINPICRRSDTTDVDTLGRCLDTTEFAIRAVSNASNDFDEACKNLDDAQAADQGLDISFLRFQVCGEFGGQGQFYGNTDDAITSVALLKVALEVSTDDDTDPALRYICRGLDLSLYRKLQLSADTLYDIACGGLYIPSAPSSTSSSSASSTVSSTTPQSSSASTLSSYSLTTPPTYSTSTSSWPIGYSSTSCTTSSSSSSVAVYRRQADTDDVDYWIKVIDSALFALGLIESNEDDESCDVGDYWIDQWDSMGYFGDYVQALVCASAANSTIFPPRTIVQARASLITVLRGIILARDDPTNLARKIACDNLSYAVLVQVEFDAQDITAIINFVCYPNGSSSSSLSDVPTSSTSSSVSGSSTPSSTSVSSTTSTSGSISSATISTSSGPTSTSSSSSTTSSSTSSTSSSSSSSFSSSFSSPSSSSTSSSSSSSSSLSSSSSTSTVSTSTSSPSTSSTPTSSSTGSLPSSTTTSTTTSSSSGPTTTSTTSSSSSSGSTVDPNSTTSSSSSYVSPPCSYAYVSGGYYYDCKTTTLDTSYSTTGTPNSY